MDVLLEALKLKKNINKDKATIKMIEGNPIFLNEGNEKEKLALLNMLESNNPSDRLQNIIDVMRGRKEGPMIIDSLYTNKKILVTKDSIRII